MNGAMLPPPVRPPPRVFVVDDQPAILKALTRLLASAGFAVAPYESAQAFLASGAAAEPGCLVLDLSMPDMDGMALQQALATQGSVLPLIFLTGHGDIASGVRAMKQGAFDFLTKPVDADELMAAVQAALELNTLLRTADAERDALRRRYDSLTPREREVMALLVEGLLNKQVAAQLGTVEKTVKVHRARVMQKMQVRSLTALVRLADKLRTR
ncbi:LuxR family transcriptional regulator [Massilia sp. Root351]|uniref:response regulator transcription factor n=1 Tax=Massilia sp. Root351 TaxID=1736522 RepID=UPI000708A0AD|nr:response regulator [Massilia sp. Root351]KQV90702.1 LuxR family transcriptional regulator [Massilia sp. Root351]